MLRANLENFGIRISSTNHSSILRIFEYSSNLVRIYEYSNICVCEYASVRVFESLYTIIIIQILEQVFEYYYWKICASIEDTEWKVKFEEERWTSGARFAVQIDLFKYYEYIHYSIHTHTNSIRITFAEYITRGSVRGSNTEKFAKCSQPRSKLNAIESLW